NRMRLILPARRLEFRRYQRSTGVGFSWHFRLRDYRHSRGASIFFRPFSGPELLFGSLTQGGTAFARGYCLSGVDSLAPAFSALADLRLRPNSFRRFPRCSSQPFAATGWPPQLRRLDSCSLAFIRGPSSFARLPRDGTTMEGSSQLP